MLSVLYFWLGLGLASCTYGIVYIPGRSKFACHF